MSYVISYGTLETKIRSARQQISQRSSISYTNFLFVNKPNSSCENATHVSLISYMYIALVNMLQSAGD